MKKFAVMILILGLLVCTLGAAQGKELTVQMQDHSATRAIQKRLPDFEAKTGVKVNLVILPFSAMKEKQLIELTSGNPTYDVIMLDYRDVAGYGEAKWMVPLGQYVTGPDADPNLNMNDFLQTGIEGLKWKDQLYGLPFYIESTMLMYRKDLYEKNNLKVPETWEELYENAKKLNKTDFYGCTVRGLRAVGYNDYIWNGFLKSYGGAYFDKTWKPIFNNEAGIKGLEMYVKILKDAGPPAVSTFGYEEVMQEYMQGKTAQVIDATMLGAWIEDPQKSKVVGLNGYALVPKGTVRRGNSFFLMGLGVPKFSKNQNEAYKFIEWATSTDIQKIHIQEGAFMTRSSVVNSKEFIDRWPFSKIMLESLKDSEITYTPILPEWNEVAEQVSIAVSLALTGQKPPKAALDDAAVEVDKIMKKAGYYK